MPKIFALRDRMLEVQQSLTNDENVRDKRQNDDQSFGSYNSSKSFFDYDSMFGQSSTTSFFHQQQQQQQHELSSFEQGKKSIRL